MSITHTCWPNYFDAIDCGDKNFDVRREGAGKMSAIEPIHDGVARLRTKWPQTHYQPSRYGHHLILVPSVMLPKGYRETICTVLFVAPPGFPAACPDHFFTDIPIRLANGAIPHCTVTAHPKHGGNFPKEIWPQWSQCMWWSWHLQTWDPNRSSLYTYMHVILGRLDPAR